MIFVTGDMHADPGRFSMENFPEQKEMTRNDYMVICGDFGLLWDKENRIPHWSWMETMKISRALTPFRKKNGTEAAFTRCGKTLFT